MRIICCFALSVSVLLCNVQADEVYSPGDQVVTIKAVKLMNDGKEVQTFSRGTPLTVQAIEKDRIRVRGALKPGWLDASSVIPKAKAAEYFSELFNRATDDHSELFDRGMAWLALGEFDKAIADFTRCIEIKPQAADYAERGYCWMAKGDRQRAIADFTSGLKLDPRNSIILANRGLVYEALGDIKNALADFDAALAISPTALIPLQHRGGIRMQQKEYQRAVADFTAAIQVDRGCVDCYINRGQSWINSGQPTSAINDYSAALSLDETSLSAHFNRGVAWESQKQPDKAMADYNRILQLQPGNISTLYRRGYLQLMRGNAEAGLVDFDAALKIDPNNVYLLRERAHCYYSLDRFADAVADYNVLLQKNPADTLALVDRGMCYKLLNKPEEAIADYTASLDINPNHAMAYWAYFSRAELLREQKQFRKAIADYTSALSKSNNTNARYGRGSCLRSLGRITDAVADFRAVIAGDPSNLRAANDLAWALATWPDDKVRDGAEAVKLATAVCEKDGWKNPLMLDTLSAAYAEAGNFSEAVKFIKQAQEVMSPEDIEKYQIGQKLSLYESGQPFRQGVQPAGDAYLPGDSVVTIRKEDLFEKDRKSGSVERGIVLVVQAIQEGKIRVRSESAGWLDSSAVIPLRTAVDYFTNLINEEIQVTSNLLSRGRVLSATGQYDAAIADFNTALEKEPNAGGYYERAHCWYRKKDYQQAIGDFTKAIELDSKHPEYWASRGVAYHIIGELDKATTDYDAAITLDPRQLSALQNRGNIRLNRGAFAGAIADFSAAIDVDPRCVDCFINRGVGEVKSGIPEKGIEDYSKALNLDGSSVAALFNRGVAYQMQGKYTEALADFNRLLQVQPNNVGALQLRGQVRYAIRDYAGAEVDLRSALIQRPTDRYILRDLARTLFELGKYGEAVTTANRVLESHPDDEIALLFRGVSLQALGKQTEAINDIHTALATNKLPNNLVEFAHYRCGSLYQQAKDYEKAIAEFTEAIKFIQDPFALYGRARCYLKSGMLQLAISDFKASIAAKPDFAPAYNALAWLLATWPDASVRNGTDAVEYAHKACELTGWKDASFIDTLAAAHAEAGDFNSAVMFQKRSLEFLPPESREDAEKRLKLFGASQPFRQDSSELKQETFVFPVSGVVEP